MSDAGSHQNGPTGAPAASPRQRAERLARLAMQRFESGDAAAAVATARESAALARQVLAATRDADPQRDAVVGEFGAVARDAGYILLHGGQEAEARQLLREGLRATTGCDGPRSRRSRAAIMLLTSLSIGAQVLASLAAGRPPPLDPAQAIGSAELLVGLQREVATAADPPTLMEFAQGLHLLGQLYRHTGQGQPAADAFAEAWAIFAGFDGPDSQTATSQVLGDLNAFTTESPGVQVVAGLPGSWRGPDGSWRSTTG